MEKLILIDGNSLINRAFYAMPPLTTKDGTFTNAVYGFMNMLFKMLEEIKPEYMAVAFDLKAPTFRHKLYSEYKGTRKPMPEELRPQIPLLKELLSIMGIKTVEKEGSEADDIIGTIAKHTSVMTYIFTGDKDSFQLVDEQTEVHFTKRGITDVEIYTSENFTEKTELIPSQIIDLKSLMGDSSDNIPGIPGVGEKTAKTLLLKYGTVDGLYEHVEELSGKLKEKVVLGKDSAFLSKTLATIDCDCGVDTDLNGMLVPKIFSYKVKEKFINLEFKSLIKKDKWFEGQSSSLETADSDAVDSSSKVTIERCDDLEKVALFNDKRVGVAILDDAVYLSDGQSEIFFHVNKSLLDDGFSISTILGALSPIANGKGSIVTFSKKELRHALYKNAHVQLSARVDDLSLVKYLADFSGREETLIPLLEEYGFDISTPATSLLRLFDQLYLKLKQEGMESLYLDVELPLTDTLYDMETAGFKIDYESLNKASEVYKLELTRLEKQIRDLADDQTINVNSPKQLGELLFEKLKIGKGKKTKSGYSTSADVLESYETAHPVVPLILAHRKIQKIQSTYVEGFKPLIDRATGLIHTSFNQTVTATGRLSSKEPNLQNIPVRDDIGKEIRKFFVPKSSDRILIGADYSQIELRLLASFSKCKSLIDAFNSNKDIHSDTASKVFKVAPELVTPQMRSNAKAVNFGIIYGMSEYGLAKQLKISSIEARNFIDAYFKEFPEVRAYMDENVNFAKENGYAVTLLGRKRHIKELSSPNFNLRSFGERVAMNMPLQGSSADIIKLAMLGVNRRLKKENLKSELILQVHDELIIDAFKDEREKVEQILVQEMEGAVKLAVSLTVSLGSGATWFDAK
jgi:DNA polymerase-1